MKFRAIILISCFIVFNTNISAQLISFINVYGNTGYDYGRDIKEDIDSGFVVTGSSTSFGSADGEAYLMKVDRYGDFLWSYNYGGTASEWGESVVITTDSTYAIAGYTNSEGNGGFDFYLIRADSAGIPLWTKTYGGADWDRAYDLVEMPDSGFVLVGETFSFGGSKDAYIVRTNKDGDTIWTKTIGGVGEEFLNAVFLDGDSIVVCGGTSSFGQGMLDGYICKMDLAGNVGWEKYLGKSANDYFTSIDAANGYYVLGGIRSYNEANAAEDMWVYKLSEDGNTFYLDTTYLNLSVLDDGINDLRINTGTEDVYYAGYSESWGFMMDGMPDVFLGKMTSSGFFFTQNTYGDQGMDALKAMDNCKDFGVVFLGDTEHYATGGNNIIIIKLTFLWAYPNQFTDLTFHDITTSTIEITESKFVNVFPNPCKDNLVINCSSDLQNAKVISLDGKIIIDDNSGEKSLDMTELPSGVYILKLSIDGQTYTSKIIRE